MLRLISFFILIFSASAFALSVDAPLSDSAQEARAKGLFYEIRCVVCQSEAIADSPAEVARDMRRVVRERISNGQSDEQIKADLAKEYGDVILMNPPLKQSTIVLWFAPWLALVFGGYLVFSLFKRTKKQ
jgi:cytochrome c-type biogenesis protein CcmH